MKERVLTVSSCLGLMLLTLYVTGCASFNSKLPAFDRAMAGTPQDPGSARICFVRSSAMLGAVITHYAVDCGTELKYDAKLIRGGDVTIDFQPSQPFEKVPLSAVSIKGKDPMHANKDVMGSVSLLVLPPAANPVDDGVVTTQLKRFLRDIDLHQTGAGTYVRTQVDIAPCVEAMKPNCRYVGGVKSGGYAIFDRAPGTMRLRVITRGGDEGFAPDFVVEAGKQYVIDYQYGLSGVQFIMHPRPAQAP